MREEELKYKCWMITINMLESGYLPSEKELIKFFESHSSDYVFQKEKGEETEREHYQCAVKFRSRKRKSTVINLIEKDFPQGVAAFQVDRMYGTFAEAIEYCTKEDTRVGYPVSNIPLYSGADIAFLEEQTRRFPWQVALLEKLCIQNSLHLKAADDREIIWITDTYGNSGKSKFTKYMCLHCRNTTKIAFGTSSQMKSSVIDAGPKSLYLVDIPRTLGFDEDMSSLFSSIEEIKNGFLVSSMYGKNKQLFMDPPHVIVFTNQQCPRGKLSIDRWTEYYIDQDKQLVDAKTYKERLYGGILVD